MKYSYLMAFKTVSVFRPSFFRRRGPFNSSLFLVSVFVVWPELAQMIKSTTQHLRVFECIELWFNLLLFCQWADSVRYRNGILCFVLLCVALHVSQPIAGQIVICFNGIRCESFFEIKNQRRELNHKWISFSNWIYLPYDKTRYRCREQFFSRCVGVYLYLRTENEHPQCSL